MKVGKVLFQAVAAALLWCVPAAASADDGWLDVTAEYVVNADFDGNSSRGWTWQSDASSQVLRCDAMEFWNGRWHLYQVVSDLPRGEYRLRVQAFYRCREHAAGYQDYLVGREEIHGRLFAGRVSVPLASIYTFHFDAGSEPSGCWGHQSGDGTSTIYFPNTMESGTEAFRQGGYWNELVFWHEGGDLQIGLVNEVFVMNNWCLFDSFRLEFHGDAVPVEDLKIEPSRADLIEGETVELVATVVPSTATFRKLMWTTSDESVATVDSRGRVTACGSGTAVITASSTDGSGVKATARIVVVRNEASSSSLIINEIMASNVDEYVSPAFNFDGWVELYNPTDRAVSLGGIYMSDERGDLRKWRTPRDMGVVPAHGYRLVWFDSNDISPKNAPFKLDVDGGALFVSNASGRIVASADYPASKERTSYARTTDGSATWSTTDRPTPGLTNDTAPYATVQLEAPVVSQPSQFFTDRLTVDVEIPAGTTLRYTTDGTLPTLDNGQTSRWGQFYVNGQSAIYRFRLFADGSLASPVTTRTYIYKDRDYMLPVVSVVSDPRFLYDDSLGVCVQGVNGRPGNGQSAPCNWNMNWERPVNFSYIDAAGEMVLNQDVNLEMCGGWSRAWTPHSFKLKGNKELGGSKKLPYAFFSAKPYVNNRTLQVRNGGNDTWCRIKDPAIATIVQTSGIDVDLQSYQPVHEFINGQYVGVLNVREPNNKHYVYANYGWDDEEIDQFEISPDSFYVQKCGDDEAYKRLVSLSAYASDEKVYEEIRQLLDVDEYANYMATCFFLGSSDWTRNNVKAFRHRDGGRFRFVLFDTDSAFDIDSNVFQWFMGLERNFRFDLLYPSLTYIYADNTLVTLFRQLLANAGFRRKFIDTFCVVAGSVFEESRAVAVIDSLVAAVAPAMSIEGTSPAGTANNMKASLSGRCKTMVDAMRSYSQFRLSEPAEKVVLGSNAEEARIEVNGVAVPTGHFDGYLFRPAKLRAVCPAGYKFLGWRSGMGEAVELIKRGDRWLYYCEGSLDGKEWTAADGGGVAWKSGTSPLGYGKSGVATTISYGSNASDKRPTYYFRKTFGLVERPAANSYFTLEYSVDDGFIVYVNGQEAGRYNMPAGTVRYGTFATTWAPGNPDVGSMQIPGRLFQAGENVVCVEVHNNSATSTDIYWDGRLTAVLPQEVQDKYFDTNMEMSLPEGGGLFTACYAPLDDSGRLEEQLPPVRINEVSVENSAYVNEYGKKSEWIELYNTTSEVQDVAGMYLTNDLAEPNKYQIGADGTQARTTIAPHGRLLLWCDKLATTDKGLHAPFRLAADGGAVALSAADGGWADTLRYGVDKSMTGQNYTYGRYPDGGESIYLMTVPTIGQANLLSSYDEKTNQQELALATLQLKADADGGLHMSYSKGCLLLRGTDSARVVIEIFTSGGQKVQVAVVDMNSGFGTFSTGHLKPGMYIARAKDGAGRQCSCKLIKN